ncbi:hypothetical protein VTK73DRAFT_3682 [Phialemonium thermophilum]|uniref:Peptidase S53 activation domain-containing protein n=1 Tax=Phialemonium thermophilum TaxID=223376 RepID=A0ABR3VG09_9PEZI
MLLRQLVTVLAAGLAVEAAVIGRPVFSDDFANGITARHVPRSHVLHERQMPHWSKTWAKRDRLPSDFLLPMRIGLKQENLEEGHRLLMDISDPRSPNFGKHMTAHEVIDFFAPSESRVRAVTQWLAAAGIDASRVSLSANKQWVQFDATTAEVESLLFTEYYVFEHAHTGTQNIAADGYHVPAVVQEHIDYITPGIRLRVDPGKAKQLKRRREAEALRRRGFDNMNTGIIPMGEADVAGLPPLNSSVCDTYVTPQCIRTQYKVPKGRKAAAGNELGIFESLNDHYSKEDLDAYWAALYPEIPQGTYPTEKLIDGAIGAAQTPDQVGPESNLDFEAAWPLIWPQKTVLFQTDDQYYEINMTSANTPYLGFWNS